MKIEEIKELIKIFDESTLSSFEMKNKESEIKLERGVSTTTVVAAPAPAVIQQPVVQSHEIPQASAAANTQADGTFITSPMVGTFYKCPSPDAPAYVKVGDTVRKGQTVAIIEAMKIMNELEAEFDCKILDILQDDGQPLEYGAKIFRVEKI